MNIFLSFDYEIYFGEKHGTVDKCIIYPTSELLRIAEKYSVHFSFFVDCGFLIKLNEFRKQFPQLEADYKALVDQVKYMADTNHDIQLHIHPHWEDSYYNGERWIMETARYKLTDFNTAEIDDIVYRYKKVLTDITQKEVFSFRAGGWCLQPFDKIRPAFKKYQISMDSTVFKNGYYTSKDYFYDFRKAPLKDLYHFENDPGEEEVNGYFTELPITAIRNSPLFFWLLFLLGRKNPYYHKPLGDGRPIPAKGYRKRLLTSYSNNPVSMDGYNAKLLQKVLKDCMRKSLRHMVVIGHPKALSRFSIEKIEQFVKNNSVAHNFITYTKFKNSN